MKKTRINELARELEVKPQVILDLLPEFGVAEKKTHSSSIDDEVAVLVRERLAGGAAARANGHGAADGARTEDTGDREIPAEDGTEDSADSSPAHEAARPAASETPIAATAHAGMPSPAEFGEHRAETLASPDAGTSKSGPEAHEAEASASAVDSVEETPVKARPVHAPLRPPLSSGRPIQPPFVSRETNPTPVPRAPAPPAMPVHPGPAHRSVTIPARPAPVARPGQIIAGPRQPLPAGPRQPLPPPPPAQPSMPGPSARAVEPSSGGPVLTPSRPAGPSQPAPRPGAPIAPRPPAPAAVETLPPGQQPLRAQSRPGLAGQPGPRPVVPPRADILARLQQGARTMPGQAPMTPRPGMPTRPQASPVPGQPIYRGPIRPGQPIMRGPGMPGGPGGGPGSLGARSRVRPMHPTSPLRVEPATIPTEQQRRHQGKPVRPGERRDRDQEGNLRMPYSRRSEPIPPPPIDREITIAEGITVKELSEKLGVKANLVIKKLVEKKIFANINQTLDVKLAEELSREFGASTNKVSYEEETIQEIEIAEDAADRVKRAPVVTIMGHVDHGKTSLLDAIRLTNVAEREAGGITQHIGAYFVEKNGRKIVFIDTPGHEAFTRMRARGAKVTDIVILVVAADDGVMPQTLEAIDHAKAAGVPIIVAINKIDKPDAQPERIKQQLADRNLLAEDWGGDTVMVPVSAKAKTNLDLLLEMILLVADLQDLKANPERPAFGAVLEAKLDRGRGPVATVLVRNGTLRVGDYFICGSVFGKVRAMYDGRGQQAREAEPSMPVEVLGLESLPEVGDTFQVVTDTAKAKQIVIYREAKVRDATLSKSSRITLEQLHEQMKEGEVKELNIILKTDVGGTAEVLTDMMTKLSNDKVKIRVLRAGVGAINESDVLLASASNAIIVGFNVRPERNATAVAEHEKVDIRLHTIIYELTDELKRAMTGMLEPVFKEVYRGRAEIRDVFRITKVGNVAGCMVLDGMLTRDSEVRLLRDSVVVYTGKIESLKRFKNDASEVKSGFECGVTLRNFADMKPNDVIEAFVTERVAPEVLV